MSRRFLFLFNQLFFIYSEAIVFFRAVCLETTFRLMNHENRCSLNATDVQKILQDGKFIKNVIHIFSFIENILLILLSQVTFICLKKTMVLITLVLKLYIQTINVLKKQSNFD